MAATRRVKKDPGKREEIEEFLDSKSVKYTFRTNVDLKEFDLEKSLRNQARINMVLSDIQVETYVDAMKRGDDFPAVVAYYDGPKMIAVDGNHRLQAAKIAGKKVSVYVLDKSTDAQTLVHLTFEANTRHGLPNSVEERVQHGIYMLSNGAQSQEMVAQRINVPLATLKRAWTKKSADDRAVSLSIPRREWETLSVSSRMRLKSLSTDEGFAALADLAIKAKLDSVEVDALVTQMNKSRSGASQRAIVAQHEDIHRKRIQAGGSGLKSSKPRTNSARNYLSMAMGHINAAANRQETLLDLVAPAETTSYIAELEAAAESLLSMVETLKSRK